MFFHTSDLLSFYKTHDGCLFERRNKLHKVKTQLKKDAVFAYYNVEDINLIGDFDII